jgi:penicillin-binding protein 2
MRSCNPYFWHIGLELFRQGYPEAIADMAEGFGLGSPTGIQGVEEEAGNIPSPETEVDALNNAIGQGDTLVTPLQVAQFVAAVGNGGTIYQPQLIERIAAPDGEPTFEFVPISKGTLPVSPENLAVIQDAMVSVVENRRGTAAFVLGSYSRNSYAMAGKTGTAESGSGDSHAWFAGYTRENRENKPDIVIVVIAENAGEGSEIAAPIFRGMVQQYFDGQRYYLLPWEDDIGVIALPEEEEVDEE